MRLLPVRKLGAAADTRREYVRAALVPVLPLETRLPTGAISLDPSAAAPADHPLDPF